MLSKTYSNTIVSWNDLKLEAEKSKIPLDLDLLQLAYELANQAHQGQLRATGEPYIHHPLATAKKLIEMQMEQDVVIAGLLHDVPEDTSVTIEAIEKDFGSKIAKLVAGVTKLSNLKYRGLERYAENLRKMFIAMSADIRVIIIKFADRWHNLTTLEGLKPEKRERIAREALEIYVPIADRLGIGGIKTELEDLAFQWLQPKEFAWLQNEIASSLPMLEDNLNQMEIELKSIFIKDQVKIISQSSRRKGLYSLYKKLINHDRDLNRIFDLIALRIIVPDISSCYQALGSIHAEFTPLPGRIKDYIALPKANGYQSLHTTIFTKRGDHSVIDGRQVLEIQIRTPEMHEQAEYGITAHWHYKEHGATKADTEQLKWVKDLVEWQKHISNEDLVDNLKMDIFKHRIFVLTPNGDAINLPEDATVIDFAYALHTDIGNSCVGARVNAKMVPLNTILKSGDVVEILRDKNRKKPNVDWLSFAVTSGAKEKMNRKLRELDA